MGSKTRAPLALRQRGAPGPPPHSRNAKESLGIQDARSLEESLKFFRIQTESGGILRISKESRGI